MPSLVGNKPNQVPSNGDLGTLAFQDANSVKVTGGVVDGVTVGGTTRAAGSFTTVTTTNDSSISGLTVGKGGGAVATNTAVGLSALGGGSQTGTLNTAVGWNSLAANTSGSSNSAFGRTSLFNNTTGNDLVAVGVSALVANTTGSSNTALGSSALQANTTASNNTAVGFQAGYSTTTNGNLTAMGATAGYNSTALNNTFFGAGAGYSNTTGGGNTIIGAVAGYALTTGQGNTFIGGAINGVTDASGRFITTGSKNTILGCYSGNQGGLDIRTASNYIVLSDGDGNPRGFFDGSGNYVVNGTATTGSGKSNLYFAAGSNGFSVVSTDNTTNASFAQFYANSAFCGNITRVGTTSAVNYGSASDYRLKENIAPLTGALDKVLSLNPVTYDWKSGGSSEGFIAHELAEICPNAVNGEKDAINEDGSINPQSIDQSKLVATLVSAIQELNAKLEAQALEIATLKGN
jgi:hypothetical protein